MSDQSPPLPPVPAERRTLRWLLGAQVFFALALVAVDVGTILPDLLRAPSSAPELNRPTQPGDQTRRYKPSNPTQPGTGIDPDMPSQMTLQTTGAESVLIRGAIAPGDGRRIAAELQRLNPSELALDSPGGSVSDALEIGRMVRQLELETRIEAGAMCLSACPYVFVGGTTRDVQPEARFGVHQHSYGESTILPAFLATQDIQSGQAEVLAHFERMGIDLRIMGPALATPANEIYILSAEELNNWNVVTSQ